ncbi:hypothetical protein H6F75_20710 [Nodosilinea sp. FACHB-131]|uniref:hypothetical protein n=1 Tax=Cyanophyceae TaxID=3028117 RepID=UPI00168949C2|nr:hypothetical protein [Nodosilinea sp. FACHB-131]MBD1875907.1 hypothetical protein [Nodosilinea sp. FACHB-131]
MTNPSPTPPREGSEISSGMLLLLGCHALAMVLIFFIGMVTESHFGNYSSLAPIVVGLVGFLFWQLLYVVPLITILRRRGRTAMAKGVVIMAVLTALLNGLCSVSNPFILGLIQEFIRNALDFRKPTP